MGYRTVAKRKHHGYTTQVGPAFQTGGSLQSGGVHTS